MRIVEKKLTYRLGDTFILKPLADWHIGSKLCDKQALFRYLADIDDRTLLVGLGDLLDSIIVKDIRYRKHLDDTKSLAIVDEQLEYVAHILEPYKSKIIGLGRGNHEDVIAQRCGTDPVRRLAVRLGTESLGYSWVVKLKFEHESGGRVRKLLIRGHHGWGAGSRTQGYSITKYSREAMVWDCDIFLYGHDHKKQQDVIDRMVVSGKGWQTRPKYMFFCGTFKRVYTNDDLSTWEETKGFQPAPIGGVNIFIRLTEKWFYILSDAGVK